MEIVVKVYKNDVLDLLLLEKVFAKKLKKLLKISKISIHEKTTLVSGKILKVTPTA